MLELDSVWPLQPEDVEQDVVDLAVLLVTELYRQVLMLDLYSCHGPYCVSALEQRKAHFRACAYAVATRVQHC